MPNKPTTEQAVEEISFREAILPPSLQELRQKLGQKAKQQKRYRFYRTLLEPGTLGSDDGTGTGGAAAENQLAPKSHPVARTD